jgi:hypothetical protein
MSIFVFGVTRFNSILKMGISGELTELIKEDSDEN